MVLDLQPDRRPLGRRERAAQLEKNPVPATTSQETPLSAFLRNPFPPDDVVSEEVAPWGVHVGITRLHIRSRCR